MADVGVWDFAPAGYPAGAVLYNGPMLFPAGLDVRTTKTGMLVFGPGGAVANFPAVKTGPSGLSPIINFSQVQHAYNEALPTPNPVVTLVDPGSNGTRAVYNCVFHVNAGQPGPPATLAIGLAQDLVGALNDGISLIYDAANSVFRPVPPKVGGIYSTGPVAPTPLGTTPQRALQSILVPAQPWPWWPIVRGQVVVTDAADTRVDLVARINTASGDQVGYAINSGSGATPKTMKLESAFGAAVPGAGNDGMNGIGYGRVAKGVACTVFLRAENQTSSSNQWSTGNGTFQVEVRPVP